LCSIYDLFHLVSIPTARANLILFISKDHKGIMMSTQIDTIISNRSISQKLKGMLVDLVNNAEAIFDSVKEIRDQARTEGFEDYETDLLLKTYLEKGLGKAKARYILYEKPRLEKQKKLTDNNAKIGENDYNNVPEIPAPDYNIVFPDHVIEEVIQEQKQEQVQAQKPNHEVEELRLRLDTTQANLDQERADKK
jgi:hypothetical protein